MRVNGTCKGTMAGTASTGHFRAIIYFQSTLLRIV